MKINFRKLSYCIIFFSVFALLLSSHGWSKSRNQPLVVRKKVIVQTNNGEKSKTPVVPNSRTPKHALTPKSDESIESGNSLDLKLHETASVMNTVERPPYDPKGKIDPFQPFFKDKQEVKAGKLFPVKTEQKKTPLENIDLGQLKLSGIILAQSGNKAVVEEASGKGHIIAVGTYIGTRSGTVAEILQDRIVVEEKMQDVYGKIFVKKRELKIIKGSDNI